MSRLPQPKSSTTRTGACHYSSRLITKQQPVRLAIRAAAGAKDEGKSGRYVVAVSSSDLSPYVVFGCILSLQLEYGLNAFVLAYLLIGRKPSHARKRGM